MICATCHHGNLDGGVRCVYCGAHFAPDFDFDIAAMGRPAAAPTAPAAPPASGQAAGAPGTQQKAGRAGIVGTLAILALKGKSLLTLLKLGKILTTLGSMMLFIAADARIFGWQLGVGLALSIFVHEMGHVVVNWRKGLKQSAPVFIPFVGAVIFLKGFPDDPTIQSESGAGGPVAGALAAIVCLGAGMATGQPFWFALAALGFAINLFNLVPFPPLDGSHICTVFSPRLWDAVLIAQLLFALKAHSGMLWMILVIGFLFRLGRGSDTRYLLARPAVRARMAFIYLALCVGLAMGVDRSMDARAQLRTVRSAAVTTQRTAAAQQMPAPPSDPDLEAFEARALTVVRTGALILGGLLWIPTALLLARAAGRGMGRQGALLIAAMLAATVALHAALGLWRASDGTAWAFVGAFAVGSAGALIYAGYQAHHLRRPYRGIRPGLFLLTSRCLAWAAFGGLVVAYAASSLAVAAIVLLAVALFHARYPWLAQMHLAHAADQLGAEEKALARRQRALALRPDSESAAALWLEVAALEHGLSRGGACLEALDARRALLGAQADDLLDLPHRAGALIRLDRFDEALAALERLVQAPPGDPTTATRLLAAHQCLSELARYREWSDEAAAQSDWVLRALPRGARKHAAVAHALKAAALVEEGRLDEAEEACRAALAASREPGVEAYVAMARAAALLRRNDPAAAERESDRAIKLRPGGLAVRFCRGAALLAAGRRDEGVALLRALASEYPEEHWGRAARARVERMDEPAGVPA